MKRAIVLLPLFLFACGPDAGGGATSSSAKSSASAAKTSASAKSSASAPASASAAPTDTKPGKMANCPSSVANAKTDIKDTDKGVEILVTSTDKAAIEDIRTRGKKIPEHATTDGKNAAHSGKGGGGGSMGRCPIVQNDTTIAYAEIEGGAKFTVEPKDEKERDWLRREAKERLAEMGDARGDRKMANCPSTVEGAQTTIKEAAGTVVVTVVAKDPKDEASTKSIRERAKKLAEGKHDKKDNHDGSGSGPKAGRCPAAIEGTKSAVKDVDGGAETTLTPEKKEDLKKVLEEAQDRAKSLD
jgi:hypothetical protein